MKNTFTAKTFASKTFASGMFTGSGTSPITAQAVGGPFRRIAAAIYRAGMVRKGNVQ